MKSSGTMNTAKLSAVDRQPMRNQRIGCADRDARVLQVLGAKIRVAYHRLMRMLMAAASWPRAFRYTPQYGVNAPSAA